MRIISQKGLPVVTDIPYEKVVVSQQLIDPSKIIAWDFLAVDEDIILMAKYSTPEKAEKAMQLLHEAYTGAPLIMKNVEVPDDFAEQLKDLRNGIITVIDREDNVRIEQKNTVFRFPEEDEI